MLFAESHEWIKITDRIGHVGISNHAKNELGEIVYVELPQVGNSVKAGQEVAVLESTKAAADIYSPVSGVITEVNTRVRENPCLINSSPEEEGWLFQIEISQPQELDGLIDQKRYLVLTKN